MSESPNGRPCSTYRIEGSGGRSYVVYNAADVGNPADHVPDKWYVRPYPISLGLRAGEPFDTAEEAERSVLS